MIKIKSLLVGGYLQKGQDPILMHVYNTLFFAGKRITIIPFYKDEGKEGDRDFLQWDTVSLMSLLGVHVVIAYYTEAEKSSHYQNKITKQRFDYDYLVEKISSIINYQSDSLHWNIEQVKDVGKIGTLAIQHYERLSKKLGVKMHSVISARSRIDKLIKNKEAFMNLSRTLAKKAQFRESITIQPKESLSGTKGLITIINYLGGYYFFTADEIRIDGKDLYLIEAKHSKSRNLPSEDDIKDGLVKMILFTNLVQVQVDNKNYNPIAVLKLSSGRGIKINELSSNQRKFFDLLKIEAATNNFKIELL